jgi:hypothetical protein
MVEPQPSKLMMWVRSPSPAPELMGSESSLFEPAWSNTCRLATIDSDPIDFAHIAQSVEHFLGKEEVTGSNPVMGSRT